MPPKPKQQHQNGNNHPGQPQDSQPDVRRERIAEVQRARILAAMAETATELGAGNVTVADVVARSGVSRRTFYEHFSDREECFLTAFDQALCRLSEQVEPAYRRPGRWRERIRSALEALLVFLEEERPMGCLLLVQALGAGPRALERRQAALAHAIRAVDEGRGEARPGQEPGPLAAEGVVGAVFSLLHARLLDPSEPALLDMLGELMSMVVLPYLGAAAARKELARPNPPSRLASKPSGLAGLRELDMRLTYRTIRALHAVGGQPGASNRQVAEAAEIHDQGQVSKLLKRLEDLGLVVNSAERRIKGEANAWTLTGRGAAVREAISAAGASP